MKEMDGESDAIENTNLMLIFRLVPKKIYGCAGSYKCSFSIGKYQVFMHNIGKDPGLQVHTLCFFITFAALSCLSVVLNVYAATFRVIFLLAVWGGFFTTEIISFKRRTWDVKFFIVFLLLEVAYSISCFIRSRILLISLWKK